MRNNKMKGFTLVELLVVIAILAILATVSVVGYTSFIESATVSNDENIAAQLNNFLVAMKADHTGKYYGEEIDENNIREVTDYILQDSGLEELVPQAEKYGYHFYYDLEEDKYVVMKDADVNMSAMNIILNAFADEGPTYEVKLENSFTQGNRYFFVGTPSETSPLSLIVDAFYKFDSANYTDLDKMVTDLANVGLTNYVKDLVVVTDECNYRLGSDPKYVLFVDGVNMVGTTTKVWNGTDWEPAPVNSEYVLATLAGKLTIPSSVKFFAEDALNLGAAGTIVINKTVNEVAGMAYENFANSNVTLKLTDGTYYTADAGKLPANTSKPVIADDVTNTPTVELPLEYKNPMTSFSGTLSATTANKVLDVTADNHTWAGYIAWDVGSFTINSKDFIGTDPTLPATQTGVKWYAADDSKAYISVTGNTVTINYNSVENIDDMPSTLTIIGEGTESNAKIEFVIETVYLTGANYTLDGESVSDGCTITLLYGETDSLSYAFTQSVVNVDENNVSTPLQNKVVEGITLTCTPTITTTDPLKLSDDKASLVLTDATAHGNKAITIHTGVYSYLDKDVNIELFNADSLVFAENNSNLVFVGDANAITLADLFKHNTGHTIPDDAEIWILQTYDDTKFSDMGTVTKSTYVDMVNNNYANVISLGGATSWDAIKGTEINFASQTATADNFESTGTGANNIKATVVVVAKDSTNKYVRISDNHEVTIVAGKNVHTIADLADGANNILVSNLAADGNYTPFTLNNKTLYGNGFSIDFRGHTDTRTGITALITLKAATLRNVNVVGNVYASSEFNFQNPTNSDYGASLVYAQNNSTIKDTYLANTRSPLITNGSVTVADSVIFGGNYANIDVQGGTLTLTGNVTTINQVIDDVTENVVGAGIVVDFDAPANTTINISSANLKQYNYVSKEDAALLPKVYMDFGIEDITIEIRDKVRSFFTNSTLTPFLYTQYVQDGETTTEVKYFNAGIIFLNGADVSMKGKYTGKELPMEQIVSIIGITVVDSLGGNVTKSSTQLYGTTTLTEVKGPKEVARLYYATLTANSYFHIPMPDDIYLEDGETLNDNNTNNGAKFDNDASDYLPSKYLPAN